ncbi:2-amino-4-hydroxy-6-hydroxymethyldihydropteridine diphosphokinase [Nitrosomonas sp. JL21]|uniref:2-amino-4-hydroxy-6- hydroxymethyldihydropteridine diphosphokinase n=1 Tax=Nitrosomonas sp. JL21 TaxID=153949 RepID=UPI00136A05AB|nr:2-amino-4-hydroxy-6-hydroxymethyldihydropteridine diphosphokinase [Nitrosomonas sp. JL21]MBL8498169.1 2-amino-4-hydroxy-6-hydroxymethyldihydropteridine diphosphokinase [Nitrosomonas sp.]MXS77254.1 2-amino-4-hydroxy-6-hydroxymethyldihydropteridine diphosphokinase [Nitrosomonas sp. JL21]
MTNSPNRAFIALGSNLDNPIDQVQGAFEELAQLPHTSLIGRSSLYRSAPVGRLDQPDFINAVACIETLLAPLELLHALLAIEQRHGRVRESLNAPRTLDLDILIYADLQCDDKALTLPHPRMVERGFVLKPLMEIAPECDIPGLGPIAPLSAACDDQRLKRLAIPYP